MLLGFSISLAFFNHAEIGLSVPLVYPFLVYLLARMLLLAFGKGVPRSPLRLNVPVNWLLVGAMFLMGLRIGLNVLNSNVIDVGYAGVIGADKLIHGHLLYGLWPKDNAYGDTYGPVNYFAYVPFRLIFGWSGRWDALPAAHAAAIVFDLFTAGGLYVLGRRMRGHAMGVVFAYAWAAYPFTLWVLSSNTNDSLVSALLVLALLVIGSAPARGVVAALAGLTKFAPFALAPLLLRGVGDRPRERSVSAYIIAFALTVFAAMLPVVLNGDLSFFWHDSVAYQAGRVDPVLDLGPVGRPGRVPAPAPGCGGRAGDRGGGGAGPPRPGGGGGARRGGADRAPAHGQLLAVRLHRVVLPAGRGGDLRQPSAVARGVRRRGRRLRGAAPAGSATSG